MCAILNLWTHLWSFGKKNSVHAYSSWKSLKYKQHKHLWGNDSDRKSPKTTSYRWKPAGAICPKSANGQVCGLPNINTFGTERYEMNWWSKHFDKICHSNRLHLVAPFCIAVHNSISFLFLFSLFLFFFFSFSFLLMMYIALFPFFHISLLINRDLPLLVSQEILGRTVC